LINYGAINIIIQTKRLASLVNDKYYNENQLANRILRNKNDTSN